MLTRTKRLNIIAIIIAMIGLLLFGYKWLWLGVPLSPGTTRINWLVETKLAFIAQNMPVRVDLSIPKQQPNYLIDSENFISNSFGLLTAIEGNNRFAIWTSAKMRGRQTLYYRLHLQPRPQSPIKYRVTPQSPLKLSESKRSAINAIITDAKAKSADRDSFIGQVIKTMNQSRNQNAIALLGRDHSGKHLVELLSNVLSTAEIIAYPIQGLRLEQNTNNTFSYWLMVRQKNQWNFYNPHTGQQQLPNDFLIWHIGIEPIFNVIGGYNAKLSMTKIKEAILPINQQIKKSSLLQFSPSTLPLDIQNLYKILLTMPLGALVILLFRNYIGFLTFGIFMPVLLALAFLGIGLTWGIMLSIIIVAFGLIVRFFLEKLQLLVVPRLSAVLVLVILFLCMISVVSSYFGFEQGVSASLFPIVILTMTIEKMCTLWEEQGSNKAIITGVGSLLVAIVAYMVMDQTLFQYLLFNFPELNLIVLAMILILGQYRGYRLSEIIRFRTLVD